MSTLTTPALTRAELIDIRDGNKRNEDIRKLLREIKRQHDVILLINEDIKIIRKSWDEEIGGSLTAIHHARQLLSEEVGRFSGDV